MRHLALGQAAGPLDEAIGKRALPVINVRNDRKIPDFSNLFHFGRGASRGLMRARGRWIMAVR
jgi:hypothetical protein